MWQLGNVITNCYYTDCNLNLPKKKNRTFLFGELGLQMVSFPLTDLRFLLIKD